MLALVSWLLATCCICISAESARWLRDWRLSQEKVKLVESTSGSSVASAAVDDAWAQGPTSMRVPRKRLDPSVHSQVRRSLSDNFPSLSEYEKDVYRQPDDGMTLRERLTEDKTQKKQSRPKVFGAPYYDMLRRRYSVEDHASVELALAEWELPTAQLLKSTGLALAHRVNRSPLRQ